MKEPAKDPETMSHAERAAEIAKLEKLIRDLQKRIKALVAVNGRGVASGREGRGRII